MACPDSWVEYMYYLQTYMDDIKNYKFKQHKFQTNERKLNNQFNK